MSKLQELIKKLCPDGVEFRKLGEVCKIMNGKDYKHLNNGIYPVYGSGGIMNYVDNFVYDKPSVLLPRKGSIGNVFYVDSPFWTVDTIYWTRINTNFIIPKFLYYYIKTQNLEGKNTAIGAVPSLTQSVLNKIEIPLPPLEVQNEIVRILETFTSHTAELQAELQARKEQYEYYRNKLLNIPRGAILELKIGEIYEFKYGVGNKIPTNPGEYPVYGSNGIVGSYNMYNNEDAPVIGHIGAYAGIVNWAKGKHFVTYNGVICKCINNMVNHRYGYYLLLLQNYISKAKTGSQPFISYDILKEPVVRIPSLSEQQRIVSILDKFESLVNDLSEGLPAEIAAVQEQYEYYRNKLLTFKRKS